MARRKSMRPCLVESCGGIAVARGWCTRHYNRWYSSGSPEIPSDGNVLCLVCGAALVRSAATGPNPKYCSTECRRRVANDARSEREKAARRSSGRSCLIVGCGSSVEFGKQLCAPHAAERRAESTRKSRDRDGTVCSDDGCGRPVRARGVCNMHYKRILHAEGRLAKQPWDDRRRANHHVRRARKAGSAASKFTLTDVIERDGAGCGLCRVEVDLTLEYPHPLSKSLDHVTPLSLGGAHSMENCQLAHLRCNVSKGNRVV